MIALGAWMVATAVYTLVVGPDYDLWGWQKWLYPAYDGESPFWFIGFGVLVIGEHIRDEVKSHIDKKHTALLAEIRKIQS